MSTHRPAGLQQAAMVHLPQKIEPAHKPAGKWTMLVSQHECPKVQSTRYWKGRRQLTHSETNDNVKGPSTDPAPHKDNWAAVLEALTVQACRQPQGC